VSKHTPGPWQVLDRRRAALKNIAVADALGNDVAEMHHVHQRDYQGSFRGDHKAADAYDAIGLANARLIAAAPELLAACKLWDEGFTEGEQFTPEQLLEWMNKNRRAARAAIAKAEQG
jgi:hypothetical protein